MGLSLVSVIKTSEHRDFVMRLTKFPSRLFKGFEQVSSSFRKFFHGRALRQALYQSIQSFNFTNASKENPALEPLYAAEDKAVRRKKERNICKGLSFVQIDKSRVQATLRASRNGSRSEVFR